MLVGGGRGKEVDVEEAIVEKEKTDVEGSGRREVPTNSRKRSCMVA